MKVEVQENQVEAFKPVTVSITFESLNELGVYTQFHGGISAPDMREALDNGMPRTSLDAAAAAKLMRNVSSDLFRALATAYDKASGE